MSPIKRFIVKPALMNLHYLEVHQIPNRLKYAYLAFISLTHNRYKTTTGGR